MSSNSKKERPAGTLPMQDVETLVMNLIMALDDFVHGHHELMQTAQFVAEQSTAMDSHAVQISQAIERRFPDLSEATIVQCLAHMVPIWEKLSRTTPTTPEEQKAKNEEFNKDLADLHAKLDPIMPPGHTYGCIDAAVSTLRSSNRSSRLLASLLISLVAEFEVLVSNLFGEIFKMRPAQAISKDRAFGWEFISSHDDLGTMKDRIIDDTVMDMMHKSYTQWLDKLGTFGVTIPQVARDPKTQEVFQRRHVIVHNGGRASATYLSKVTVEKPPVLNQRLNVNIRYLETAADRLLATGLVIYSGVAQSMISDPAERAVLDHILAKRVYELLSHRRYQALVTTLESVDLVKLGDEDEARMCKVNHWLALKRLNRFDECREEVLAWDTTVLEDQYRLARLALLDEIDEGLELIEVLRGTDQLPIDSWAAWPLLEELRRAEAERAIEQRL
jgi:hypothetical protein